MASGDERFILQITFHVTGVNLCAIKRYMGHFWLTEASVLIQKTVNDPLMTAVVRELSAASPPHERLLSFIEDLRGCSHSRAALTCCTNVVNMIAGWPETQYRCVLSH